MQVLTDAQWAKFEAAIAAMNSRSFPAQIQGLRKQEHRISWSSEVEWVSRPR
jgi:hypothetical protein